MTMKVVITKKSSFDVIQKDDVAQINVDAVSWTLHTANSTAIYPVADYNVRIMGVKK